MKSSLYYLLLGIISSAITLFAHHSVFDETFLLENTSIGIDTPSPNSQLHISRTVGHPDGATINLQHGEGISHISQNQNGGLLHLYQGNNTSQTLMRSYGDTYINRTLGNVGIGTDSPSSKMEIANGKLFLSDLSSSIILKSANGSCFELSVDNSGTIISNGIACP